MRNLILLLIFLILSFSVNILFYYISEDYRNFLKQLKNQENIEVSVDISTDISGNEEEDITDENTENNTGSSSYQESEDNDLQNDDIEDDNFTNLPTSEITLGKNYTDIINLFPEYNFNRMEVNINLFDLTNEYPDDYLEFYSKDLTIYFFVGNRYSNLKDIFSVLAQELPFSVNEVNNFGDNSFFININEDIDDNVIRLVISNKGVVFGLKINKNDYNQVKEKLDNL